MADNQIKPERRQLTILFSDIVGSSTLSQLLDPEDLREVIRLYQKICTKEIERFAGTITRYVGDGIIALFGYPRTHEDDAERAIIAGLAITNQMLSLNIKDINIRSAAEISLAVRIGISTGLVIADDIIEEGVSEEAAVIDETPNLAARIQQLAKTNTVAVHDSTKQLAGMRFEYSDLGFQPVSDFAQPVHV